MMTYEDVMTLVAELKEEEAKTQYVPHYYMYKGEARERSYPDVIYTDRYRELFYDDEKKGLRSPEARIFVCEDCGKKIGWFDLALWVCNFEGEDGEKEIYCTECVENAMGMDL